MAKLKEYLNEDSNQYGPGTDLMISLMAMLLIITFINSNLYQREKEKNTQLAKGGNFRVASASFSAADFKPKPFREMVDKPKALSTVQKIAMEYETIKQSFPYIFVIGHASDKDDPNATDRSPAAKRMRNWDYAGERATLISNLLSGLLQEDEKDRVIVVSTGEFDRRDPQPGSQLNAWVEIVFGAEWKRAANDGNQSPK